MQLSWPALVSNSYRRRPCISFYVCYPQKHGVRIIVGNFYENKAVVVFCEAFKQMMYGAKYAWIITGINTTLYLYYISVFTFFSFYRIIFGYVNIGFADLLVAICKLFGQPKKALVLFVMPK